MLTSSSQILDVIEVALEGVLADPWDGVGAGTPPRRGRALPKSATSHEPDFRVEVVADE